MSPSSRSATRTRRMMMTLSSSSLSRRSLLAARLLLLVVVRLQPLRVPRSGTSSFQYTTALCIHTIYQSLSPKGRSSCQPGQPLPQVRAHYTTLPMFSCLWLYRKPTGAQAAKKKPTFAVTPANTPSKKRVKEYVHTLLTYPFCLTRATGRTLTRTRRQSKS